VPGNNALDNRAAGDDSVGQLEKNNLDLAILVAEDNANDVFLMEHALKKAKFGNPVRFVADGEEVIAYLQGEGKFSDRAQHPFPGLLLMDIKMPRLDGLETLALIRNDPRYQRLVVIILTSSNREQDVNRAFDLRANSYLVKPAGAEGMLGIVDQIRGYWLGLNNFPRSPGQ
jgi:CheY-like chemotaxis protein